MSATSRKLVLRKIEATEFWNDKRTYFVQPQQFVGDVVSEQTCFQIPTERL